MSIFDASRAQCLLMSKQKDLILTTSEQTATVKGLLTDHNQAIDPDTGNQVNARNAHASIHEDELTEKGFTSLKLMDAIIIDTTNNKKYKVAQPLPNTTTGLIPVILKDVQ